MTTLRENKTQSRVSETIKPGNECMCRAIRSRDAVAIGPRKLRTTGSGTTQADYEMHANGAPGLDSTSSYRWILSNLRRLTNFQVSTDDDKSRSSPLSACSYGTICLLWRHRLGLIHFFLPLRLLLRGSLGSGNSSLPDDSFSSDWPRLLFHGDDASSLVEMLESSSSTALPRF